MAAAERARLADAYRREQALLAATLTRDVTRLMRGLFDPARPGPSWQALRGAVGSLIRDRRSLSAVEATRYYRASRLAGGVHTPVEFSDAMGLAEDRLLGNLDATGIASFARAVRAGKPPPAAVDAAATNLSGAASRMALEGGRSVVAETAKNDVDALGWVRIADADPCSWCLMLASRGSVYRSAGTAGRLKNDQFVGDGQFKWHDHCGCVATPVWDALDPVLDRADELYTQWLEVTAGHSGEDAINVWRRYWDALRDGETQAEASRIARSR